MDRLIKYARMTVTFFRFPVVEEPRGGECRTQHIKTEQLQAVIAGRPWFELNFVALQVPLRPRKATAITAPPERAGVRISDGA